MENKQMYGNFPSFKGWFIICVLAVLTTCDMPLTFFQGVSWYMSRESYHKAKHALLSKESLHIMYCTDHSYDKQQVSYHAMTCCFSRRFRVGLFWTLTDVVREK